MRLGWPRTGPVALLKRVDLPDLAQHAAGSLGFGRVRGPAIFFELAKYDIQ